MKSRFFRRSIAFKLTPRSLIVSKTFKAWETFGVMIRITLTRSVKAARNIRRGLASLPT
ncbi:hypothetical protein D3C86_1895520 [compost metagenome]